MSPLYTNGLPVEKVNTSEPTRFDRFLREPMPHIKGKLVRKGNQMIAVPHGLASILLLRPGRFILEEV